MARNNLGKRIKELMKARGMTQTELAERAGAAKSSISQYISGGVKPSNEMLGRIAAVLGVEPEELFKSDEPEDSGEIAGFKLTVAEAASLMGVGQQFIRVGLQTGVLPFGYAVKMESGKYTYFISKSKFTECTGIAC